MLSQSNNRVQAIKSKFENLNSESVPLVNPKKSASVNSQLCKQTRLTHEHAISSNNECGGANNSGKENLSQNSDNEAEHNVSEVESDESSEDWSPKPNSSYLYNKSEVKRSVSDAKKSLSRQISDPGKKLHRSHAFRCDRSQKICHSPKRHGSCNGRSETSDFSLKMGDKKLSKERLKKLGNLLEDQMRKENFVPTSKIERPKEVIVGFVQEVPIPLISIPDEQVPQHILDQYAKVLKPKKKSDIPENRQDAMTDSGVSSETENLEEDRSKIKKLKAQFETEKLSFSETLPLKTNLEVMEQDLCASSETMKLERKNPHLKLTDTLKKALKQPLPPGPPPKKPPRVFTVSPIAETSEKHSNVKKKGTKQMLEKLQQVLQEREAKSNDKNLYDIAETNLSLQSEKKPKEIHYLCTEILDITQRTLLPNQNNAADVLKNCFNSLNCAIIPNRSMTSLPYSRLSTGSISNTSSLNICCSCSTDSLDLERPKLSTFFKDNSFSGAFKCHLNPKCKQHNTGTLEQKEEHIYDIPFGGKNDNVVDVNKNIFRSSCGSDGVKTVPKKWGSINNYGVVNCGMNRMHKSLEDLRITRTDEEKIYDIPCDTSRSVTPEPEEIQEDEPEETKSVSQSQSHEPETKSCEPEKKKIDETKTKSDLPRSKIERLRLNFENITHNDILTKPVDSIKALDTGKLHTGFKTLNTGIKTLNTDFKRLNTDIKKVNIGMKSRNMSDSEKENRRSTEKPLPLKPKPVMVKIPSDSKINLPVNNDDEFRSAKRNIEKKFATETKRYKKFDKKEGVGTGLSLCVARNEKKDQLDVDRENLNRLMNEIYETVTAACMMDDQKPTKFPTESDATSEDSVQLTRSLTEKRKNYVRRVSSRASYLDQKAKTRFRHQTSVCSYNSEILNNQYNTFRSWKSFRHSQNNINKMADRFDKMADRRDSTDSKFNLTDSTGNILSMKDELDVSMDNLSIDEKAGCLELDLPFEPRSRGLFDVCLLVGLNYMTGKAYVKSVFPTQVKVPMHIENLVFPETMSLDSAESKIDYELSASKTQTYSLILTDEKGERSYGYCRRVLPEGATCCLPLCYCLIGRYRAPGFYYKVLKELESHHGSSEVEINTILQQLFETDFPNAGEEITIRYEIKTHQHLAKNAFRNSVNLGDVLKCKTLPDPRKSSISAKSEQFSPKSDHFSPKSDHFLPKSDQCSTNSDNYDSVPEFYDLENNNRPKVLSVPMSWTKVIKRPIEPRVDEDNLSVLLDSLGVGLLIKVFGSMLLERKVVLVSDNLSQLSSCMEGLQSIIYPFVWQQTLISTIPSQLRREILEAPLPMLAGSLRGEGEWVEKGTQIAFEEGMLIDISNSTAKVLFYQGDESTILPTASYKTLKTTLQMESSRNVQKVDREDGKTRNVLISEAFLRFFVDIMSDFWQFFSVGVAKDGDILRDITFEREAFIKKASSKQNQYFLEWFTETAMFNHFIQNMAASYTTRQKMAPQPIDYSTVDGVIDAPAPNFYEQFDERITRNCKRNTIKSVENTSKNNYKSGLNKRVKLLKTKLRDLVT